MKTGFLFFVADHLLVGQLCTNSKSHGSLLTCLNVTQCSTSEIGDSPLYNLCSLLIKVMTTGPLAAPSKCKSGWFNAWGHRSMHRMTLWRWWSGSPRLRTPLGRSGPRSSSKMSRQSLMKHPSSLLGRLPKFRCLTHNYECMCEGGLKVYVLQASERPDLDWEDKEPQANQVRQVADLNPLDHFLWSYVENITNMTSHNSKANLIVGIHRVFTELPPVLVEKACSQFRIRIEAVIETEGGYIESMSALLHNQVTWIDLFN